jgi:hypothetical protein
MSRIVIGTAGTKQIGFDLDTLLRTRLLVQADSGGGKSWLIRVLAEQAFGKVQVILIDPEGEFATLREKFDYVLVGKNGETPADPRSAGLVAHRLLELRASAVCDLYELKSHLRHQWVRLFLSAMIDAPKELWQPVLVIVDEAHVYCPEKDESEAAGAMIDLATRGRKRGFCAVFATQRLAKLDKDASSELQNRLIGPTFEDVNRKRAAEVLGILKSDEREFFKQIQLLEPGNFFALGRAISTERVLVKIRSVETSHPEMGSTKHAAEAPAAPEKIKALLPKLADLPQEAESKARTEAELRSEIRSLKAKLSQQPKPVAAAPDARLVERAVRDATTPLRKQIEQTKAGIEFACARLHQANVKLAELASVNVPALPKFDTAAPVQAAAARVVHAAPTVKAAAPTTSGSNGSGSMGRGEQIVLKAVAQYPDGTARDQITVLTGYKRSTRDAYLQRLSQRGFVAESQTGIIATEEGIAALGNDFEPLPTGDELQEYWRNRLPEGERKIFEVLIQHYPNAVAKDVLSEVTGYKRSTRDAYLQRMASKRLVEDAGRAAARASDNLFDGAA